MPVQRTKSALLKQITAQRVFNITVMFNFQNSSIMAISSYQTHRAYATDPKCIHVRHKNNGFLGTYSSAKTN